MAILLLRPAPHRPPRAAGTPGRWARRVLLAAAGVVLGLLPGVPALAPATQPPVHAAQADGPAPGPAAAPGHDLDITAALDQLDIAAELDLRGCKSRPGRVHTPSGMMLQG